MRYAELLRQAVALDAEPRFHGVLRVVNAGMDDTAVATACRHAQLRQCFKQEDIFKLDLSKASVITLYLLPDLNVKLIPQLEKLKPGSRIVSHDFDMKGVKPKKVVHVTPPGDSEREHTIYLWVTPLEKE